MKGAQPTDTTRAILRFKGVLYKKHLQRGVEKGAITQEAADDLFTQFVNDKESKVLARREQAEQEKLDFYKRVSGSPTKAYVEESADAAAATAFQVEAESPAATDGSEESPAVSEVSEDAPATKEVAEEAPAAKEVAEEAPAAIEEVEKAAEASSEEE